MKFSLILAFTISATGLFAQNDFSEFIAEDGSGIVKLQKLHKNNISKKDNYTTHNFVDDCQEDVQLVSVLLNEAVIKHIRALPISEGLIVLKSHQQWWKYFDSTPSIPNVNGSDRGIISLSIDKARIKCRWEALKLPYKQYIVYAKIANMCQVRFDCGIFKMKFGEICLKKEACWAYDKNAVENYGKYYHKFPICIMSNSCQIVNISNKTYYLAILKNQIEKYLCVWDNKGNPVAIYVLEDVEKIKSISLSNNCLIIVYQNKMKNEVKKSINIEMVNDAVIQSKYDFSNFY